MQLRCFVAVAEELHFGHAAKRLNMTQPPLSRQVQLLERILDVQLFRRSSRVVRLTHAGRVFLPEARRIVRLSEDAMGWAERIKRGVSGKIRIGFSAACGYSLVPAAVSFVSTHLPDIELDLQEMQTNLQLNAISAELIDIGLLRPLSDISRYANCSLVSEDMVAAVPAGSALARKTALSIRDFHGCDLIAYEAGASQYLHDMSLRIFNRARVEPAVRYRVGQIHTMIGLVGESHGIALIPASSARLRMPGVVFRPVADRAMEPVEMRMAWRMGDENPALSRFVSAFGSALSGRRIAQTQEECDLEALGHPDALGA